MKTIIAVLSVCLFVASSQAQNRPPPPGSTQSAPVASQRPPRPKGCSPGCGNTEICAELGSSYCRGGTSCSVCIKMSSIRFPASALAGMFQQQKQQEQVQPQATVPAQQIPVQQPANNPFSYQPAVNTYNDPFGDLFGFNEPVPQQQNQLQNNMFGLMMFEGLGFGGGFGLGF